MTYAGQVVPTSLCAFRLVSQEIPEESLAVLKDVGVPDHLIDEIVLRHEKAQRMIAQTELKILYSLLPRLRAWLKEEGNAHSTSQFSQWHSFFRRIDKLERQLNTGGRADVKYLRARLDVWRDAKWRNKKKRK